MAAADQLSAFHITAKEELSFVALFYAIEFAKKDRNRSKRAARRVSEDCGAV